jgi:membrane protease YdiL (CAAX protease family)
VPEASTPVGWRPTHPARLFVVVAVVLAAFNVARGVGWFGRWNDLAAVVLVVALVGLAAAGGVDRQTLGLAPGAWRRGAAFGAGAFSLVLLVVVVAALLPATAGFLDDDRVHVSFTSVLWQVGFGIVVATAVPEELAFRGLLLGTGSAAWGPRAATLASSALFGLWHISPTLGTMHDNSQLAQATSSGGGQALVVLGAVASTFVAGLVFSLLRLRSGSVVAPVLAHVATNGVAFVVAWLVAR